MTGAPFVPPHQAVLQSPELLDNKMAERMPINRQEIPPPVPNRRSVYNPEVASVEQHNVSPARDDAQPAANYNHFQQVSSTEGENRPPVPLRITKHDSVPVPQMENYNHYQQVERNNQQSAPLQMTKDDAPPVPHSYRHYPQVTRADQENVPPVPSHVAKESVPPVPHHLPYPVQYMPYPHHLLPWYGHQHQPIYDMSHLSAAPPGYPHKYLELGSTPPPVTYPSHMSAYYTPQNPTLKAEPTTSSGESGGTIYNPHTDSMVPGYANSTPYRPMDMTSRSKEEGYVRSASRGSSDGTSTPTPNHRQYEKRKPYNCALCRKRKTVLGEDRDGKLICRKCCEAEGYVSAVKKSPMVPRRTESEKSFTCSSCQQQRERRHFFNGELVCRQCYYAKTNHGNNGRVEKVCDNCNIKQQPDVKVYNRSKFNEMLCHNCFHYKLRNGVSRPLELGPTSKL